MATTSATWRFELMGYQPSRDGEVRRLDGSSTGATLTEGERQTLSPTLTVWRTLHLEIDSMTPPPAVPPAGEPAHPQRNYLAGRVAHIDRVQQIPGVGPRPTRFWLLPDPTIPAVELRDGSPDTDVGGGRGRFQEGTLLIGAGSSVVKLTGLYANGLASIETSSRGANVGFELGRGTNRLTGYVLTWDRLVRAFEVDRSVGDSSTTGVP